MANTLVQFREEEAERIMAASICEELGFDLPTYLRMCIRKLNQERGIPFSMKLENTRSKKAIEAFKQANRIAEENGISDMSLDEINAEIAEARG